MHRIQYYTFLLAILQVGTSALDCHIERDCSKETVDDKFICVLDVKRVCFHIFHSTCEMEVVQCQSKLELKLYSAKFCKIGDNLCKDELVSFMEKWTKMHPIRETVYSIYDRKSAPDVYQQRFWDLMSSKAGRSVNKLLRI